MSFEEAELFAVAPLPVLEGSNGQFKMQIRSERGQTKWMNISAEEFKAIEQLLLQRLEA